MSRNEQSLNGINFFQDLFQILDQLLEQLPQCISNLKGLFCKVELIERGLDIESSFLTQSKEMLLNQTLIQLIQDRLLVNQASYDVIKLKENLGMKQFLIEQHDLLKQTVQKAYQCLILVQLENSFVILDSQQQKKLHKNQNDKYNQCDVAFIFYNKKLSFCIEELIDYIKLQRVFQNNYLISIKYFPATIYFELQNYNLYIVDKFCDIESDEARHLNDLFFEKLNEISYDFESYTYIQEQIYLNSVLSDQQISDNIQVVFNIQDKIISQTIVIDQDTLFKVYCGIQESDIDQSVYFYFYENGQMTIKVELQEIQKKFMNILLSQINEKIQYCNKKEIKTNLHVQKNIPKKRGLKNYYNFLFIINLVKSIDEEVIQDQDDLEQYLDSYKIIQQTQFLNELNYQFEKSNQEQNISNLIQTKIPYVIDMMIEISDLFDEKIQPDEAQILQQCLNNIFLQDLIQNQH
ncbi:hypothetical protein ABPG72_004337 [Tetrahymena utriculariae]